MTRAMASGCAAAAGDHVLVLPADLAGPRRPESGEVGLTSPETVGNGEVKPTLFETSPRHQETGELDPWAKCIYGEAAQ